MMTLRVVIRGLGALVVFALVLASCSDKGLLSTDTQILRLQLVPAPATLEDGASTQVAVVGVQVGGRQITLSPSLYSIQWTSSDPAVLQIEGSGNFVTIRAVAAGRANVSVEVTPLASGAGASGALRVSSDVVATQVPTDFSLASQNELTGMAGAQLPDSVSVRVVDRTGSGVVGVDVNFQVLQGGGTVSKTSSTTDSLGFARTAWRLGDPGTNILQAKADKPRKNINVNAQGQSATPAAISIVGGNNQTGTAGSNLPNRLSVRVVDVNSIPIPGVAVTWSVQTGGGTVVPQSAPTDDQGISTVYWTLGTATGTQTARAFVSSMTATFAATSVAGAAARLVKLSGDAQTAALSTRLADSLTVQVVDQYGNAVSGTTVGWTVQTGGGTVGPASTTSGSNGVTRASWTMGSTAGAASAKAAIAGVDDEVFTATAGTTAPPPPPPANTTVKLSGDAQSGPVATRLTDSIAVRVQNAQGIGVAGVAVTWTVTAGNGSVSPASGTTNSNGVLRTAWTMGPSAGAATLKAAATNAGEVNFTATATASTGGSTQLTITKMSGDAQTGTVSLRLTDSLVVQVKDAQGVAMSGVNVSWAVVSGNGSVSPSSFTTNGSGFARTAWTLGSSAGAGSVSASATNATPVTFTSTANPPAVTQVTINPAVDTINALNGQVTLVATARDANNQVVPNTRFTWTSLSSATATVDSMGIVTARAAGRALIIATAVCCSKADTAAVDVLIASATVPGAPGAVVTSTTNINADTFLVTAQWGRATNATGYEWSSGASSGSWNRTATVTDTMALIRVPRIAGSTYWLCVVALNSATRSANNSCGTYTAPTTGGSTPAPVATVAVTPTNPSVGVGGTVQLNATLRDASNNILTGRTVTWQSSNSSIVSVNTSTGLATGAAGGSATITATSEGQSGSTAVTVTAAPPPPPPSGTGDTIFFEGFESGSLAVWEDGVNTSMQRIITDATAPGGTRSLEMTIPGGSSGSWLSRFFMPGYDSVFVRFHVKFATDWQSNSYLALLRGSRTDNQWSSFGKAGVCPNGTDFFYSNVSTRNGSPGEAMFYTAWTGMPSDGSGQCWGVQDGPGVTYFSPPQFVRDRWYRVEFWMKLNTPGQSNGMQRFWVDGTLRGEWTGLNFRTSNILRLNSLQLSAYGGSSSSTRRLFYDNVLVSQSSPYASSPPPPPPPPAAVASVTVTPSSQTISVGGSVQLTATTRDANGNVLTGRTVTWSSNNTFATVNTVGNVLGALVGTSVITATSEGRTGTASITVQAATPPPPTGTGEPQPTTSSTILVRDEFNYASTAELWSVGRYATNSQNGISIDPTGGLNGTPAVKFQWQAKCTPLGSDDSMLIEKGFATSPEFYYQHWMKLDPGFQWGNTECENADFKKLVLMWSANESTEPRWGVGYVTGHFNTYFDGWVGVKQNVGTEVLPSQIADGQWHRWTWHVKLETAPGRGDGIIEGWIDGVKKWDIRNATNTGTRGIYLFKYPSTFNRGSPKYQAEWLDGLVMWK